MNVGGLEMGTVRLERRLKEKDGFLKGEEEIEGPSR